MLPVSPHVFMMIVGVIEIVAGLLVLTPLTRITAWIVVAWLGLIAVNLLIAGQFDVAVRDVVMAIAAAALAQLATVYQPASHRIAVGNPSVAGA
jgi:hypothetical protein